MPRRDQAWLNAYEAKHRGNGKPTYLKPSKAVEREADLQDQIDAYCRGRGWICLRSRMDQRTTRMPGEPDLTILADDGLLIFVECKTATGKLSQEQLGFHAWAERLGFYVYVVREIDDFFSILRDLEVMK